MRRREDDAGGAWARALVEGVGLGSLLDALGRVRGERVAMEVGAPLKRAGWAERTWTYRRLARYAAEASAALAELAGVQAGAPVVVCTSNGVELPLWVVAAVRAGAVAVPLNHRSSAQELAYVMRDSGARAVVVDAAVGDRVWDGLRGGGVEDVVVVDGIVGGAAEAAERGGAALASEGVRVRTFEALWASAGERVRAPVRRAHDATCAVMYTSGTTGEPKGAMLSSASLLQGSGRLALVPGLGRSVLGWRPTLLAALPVAHIMGLATVLAAWLTGLRLVFRARFRPDEVAALLASGEVDGFLGVPSMYQLLRDAGALERDLRGVRVFASAADVMPGELMQAFKSAGRLARWGGVEIPSGFVEAYGSVELSGAALVRVSPPWWQPEAGGFVGWPLPGYRARVVDAQGQRKPPGEVGELWVRGAGVLRGYMGRDAAGTLMGEGWLRTGDLASQGRLGWVRFAGRHKDVIKSGGFSVFPAEIETKLLARPDISKAAVVGWPEPSKGAVPVAVVCGDEAGGGALDAAEILAWIGEQVAGYKRPRAVVVWSPEAMPYGPTGKIVKARVVARLEAEESVHLAGGA